MTGFEDGKDVVLGLERSSGKVLWTERFEGSAHPVYYHPDAAPVLSTPVADGERVIAYFGNYGVVALDPGGKKLWGALPHPGYVFGVGTSRLVFDGQVVPARRRARAGSLRARRDGRERALARIRASGSASARHAVPLAQRGPRGLVLGGSGRLCSYDRERRDAGSVGGLTAFPCTTPVDADTLLFAAWSTPNAKGRSFWEGVFGSLDLTDAEVADVALLFKHLDKNGDGKIVPDEAPAGRAKDVFGFLDANRNGSWELDELVNAEKSANGAGENLMVAVARGASGDASRTTCAGAGSAACPTSRRRSSTAAASGCSSPAGS